MNTNLEKIYQLRNAFIKTYHELTLYPFQEEISNAIIKAALYSTGEQFPIQVSRQSGKTEALVLTLEFLKIFYPELTKEMFGERRIIRNAVFAPQKEQAKTDFDRLKDGLETIRAKGGLGTELNDEESNSTTLKLQNGSLSYIFPLTSTSHIESKTADLLVYEESNAIDDEEKKNKADPFGTSTNAPQIYVGVGGYTQNYFYYQCRDNPRLIKHDCWSVIEQKKWAYKQDGNPFHLKYERFIQQKLEEWGENDEAFQTQYLLRWVIGAGMFVTVDQLDSLVGVHSLVETDKESYCYAGIDSAKSPDSTVLTILRKVKDKPKQLVRWLELQGDNYEDQFHYIMSVLATFNVKAVAIDSTGQGDFLPDKFERETRWQDENTGLYRVKFSAVTKDIMYKNLLNVVRNRLTELPKSDIIEANKFRQQMLDLQKEYKGELLSVHHPNKANAHDDYPDSWALAEFAYMKQHQEPEPILAFS